jgi:hypothetical protein
MRGLELSRIFYENIGKERLLSAFPEIEGQWAAGLVGEGSECFGFDDEISRDHDWGPGFCIWLTDAQYAMYGNGMQNVYDGLPKTFKGIRRLSTELAGKRVGVFGISDFYSHFLGKPFLPETNEQWLRLPETYLAVATNGLVFEDGNGAFSEIRKKLLDFYPEDVRRKKIAARLAEMAQSGQYNYPRCLKRGDTVSAAFALSRFMEAAVSVMYLLKKRYMPYYKWAFKGMKDWPECGDYAEWIRQLSWQPNELLIEMIAGKVVQELHAQSLSSSRSIFLQNQAMEVMTGIEDAAIRGKHILEG